MIKRISKFSQITELLPYPSGYRGILQNMHSTVVSEVLKRDTITRSFGKEVVRIINLLSYRVINQEDALWDAGNPLVITDDGKSEDELQSSLDDMYLVFKYIKWDQDGIDVVSESEIPIVSETKIDPESEGKQTSLNQKTVLQIKPNVQSSKYSTSSVIPTSKEDLSIQPPLIPTFNVSSIRCAAMVGDCGYAIYDSLPTIPKKQCQISATTDITKMTSQDFHNLYPNCRISTRSQVFYDHQYANNDIIFHPVVGAVYPISGFTYEQVLDNIIRYPHLFKLSKVVNGEIIGFYSTIEIDGELHKILDVWESLPESKSIPFVKEYVRDYVVRRYLLERDIKHIEHKYPMYGTLEPFLTLFTTPDEYIDLGYREIETMARQCVQSRISYKKSRNPVLRLINSVASENINTFCNL